MIVLTITVLCIYFVIQKLFHVLTYLYVLCSIQQYPEIYYYHDKIIVFIMGTYLNNRFI